MVEKNEYYCQLRCTRQNQCKCSLCDGFLIESKSAEYENK